jgi:hypothetical protein
MTPAHPPGAARVRVPEALAAALGGWVAARMLVAGALALARYLADRLDDVGESARTAAAAGLRGWDAAWYIDIARRGYGALGDEAVRFFPLQAGLARAAGLGVLDPAWPSVAVANVAALAAATGLWVLARREGLDRPAAGHAAWLLQLWPAGFALVMGYAEAVSLALAVGVFLALRGRSWWAAGGLGMLAGLARPTGFLLAVPAAIEASRGWRAATGAQRSARAVAVAGPLVGTAGFLCWVGARFGDPWLPYTVQTRPGYKGEFRDPFTSVADAIGGLVSGDRIGTGLHALWLGLAVALLVVCARRLPVSYPAYAAVVLTAAAVSENLDSFERYALGAFPLVLAAATLLAVPLPAAPQLRRGVYALAGAALSGYALLAFLGLYVP